MARLQDFQSVTPTGSDNLLIVQSQGQGLATLNAVGQKVATETTMSSLNTTSKNLVGAVNEVNSKTASDIEYSSGVTIKNKIETIENTIATSEVFTPTLSHVSTSTGASEKIWYWKSGKVVTMAIDLILDTTSQVVVVMQLPSGFRPPVNITAVAQAFGQSNPQLRYVQIFANGNVAFYSQDQSRLLFTITFGV